MFDMSWGEVLVIGAVALIVIGPKDLPKALRTVGQMTSKMRRMAADFQTQFNEAMREAELDEIKTQVSGLNDEVSSLNTSFNPIQTVRDELRSAIEAKPGAAGSTVAPTPATPPLESTSAAAALPGEPAFDLALPPTAPPPDIPAPLESAAATVGPSPARAPGEECSPESRKA